MTKKLPSEVARDNGGVVAVLAARFRRDKTGGTAIEYGLIAGLMALVCIGAFTKLGGASSGSWGDTANKVTAAMK